MTTPDETIPPLIHVGYVKTGSTWLQDSVFSRPGSGFAMAGGARCRPALAEALLTGDPYLFDAGRARRDLLAVQHVGTAPGVPVWSEEVLTGNPMVRRYDQRVLADRLRAVFPEARILVVIREQRAMVLSMYKEVVRQGYGYSLEDFIGTGDEPEGFSPLLPPWFLRYSRAVAYYQEAFGADRVRVEPFEALRRDPGSFVARIAAFAGARPEGEPPAAEAVNVGLGAVALGLARHLNRATVVSPLGPTHEASGRRILGRAARLVDRVVPASVDRRAEARLKAMIAERYGARYAEDNRATQTLTGLDLAAYGYDLGASDPAAPDLATSGPGDPDLTTSGPTTSGPTTSASETDSQRRCVA